MVDPILHTGSSHPDLLWILVPSFLMFVTGLGLATYADRIRAWFDSDAAPTSD
ncbi:hypothetical protein [Natrinema caseinilyticum]|uniref:hypothetical protein n=1 Tax=Natrinema caseinilyticum TaxID=2961570 RepID=UPI0020C5492B|nr:hypothetical protein [Natrinema caseinilyticum]